MRVAALFSGGKDSTYAAYVARQAGWDVASLITILPEDPESPMFHVPNLNLTPLLAEALGLPLIQEHAAVGEDGELDALARSFRRAHVDGIVVGAIASDYQHSRVNRVGHDLGLRVFAPLWRRDPHSLLRDYLDAGFRIVFSSVAAEGLDASWLGRLWDETTVRDLLRLQASRGVHPCGEGGEFETIVLDAPFFRKLVAVDRAELIWAGSSGVWRISQAHLEAKPAIDQRGDRGPSGAAEPLR